MCWRVVPGRSCTVCPTRSGLRALPTRLEKASSCWSLNARNGEENPGCEPIFGLTTRAAAPTVFRFAEGLTKAVVLAKKCLALRQASIDESASEWFIGE